MKVVEGVFAMAERRFWCCSHGHTDVHATYLHLHERLK